MFRLAVDTGGTFTDAVMEKDGELSFFKAASSPDDYAIGVIASIEPWRDSLGECGQFVHGTTVCLNALIQDKLPKTAFVTTKGFGDVLELQRSNRTSIYDPMYRKPKPLVPRRLCFEVAERIGPSGETILALEPEELEELLDRIASSGAEAWAICLINSYVNAEHEEEVERSLLHAGCVNVCKSVDISREYREYERACTTVLNASLMPIMSAYLDSLGQKLGDLGLRSGVHVMQSNGGITTADAVRSKPVQTVNSGIVGGIIATATLADTLGQPNMVGTDMGGTSFDVCLIVDGGYGMLPTMDMKTPKSGQGSYPIQLPTLDMHTIGAGGGSIVWLDEGGLVHVGPQSAGAEPGPACYGRGGQDPTVTDLNIILNRLDAKMFLGGRMDIYPERAEEALEPIARSLGSSLEEAADGALAVAVNNMANAIRTMTIDRGIDPSGFTVVSAGGAGPLHASLIAEELAIERVIVPNMPGNFAAWGMLCTDLKHDVTRTLVEPLDSLDPVALTLAYERLEQQALDALRADGVEPEDSLLVRTAALRYVGQGHAMEVPVRSGQLHAGDWQTMSDAYDSIHMNAYSHCAPEEPKEVAGIKVSGIGRVERPSVRTLEPGGKRPADAARRSSRSVHVKGRRQECDVYDRAGLRAGNTILGPAIVEEDVSTTLVLPGQSCTVDDFGNLVLEWGAES